LTLRKVLRVLMSLNFRLENERDIKRVYRYLNGTRNYGIMIKKSPGKYRIEAFCDASYVKDERSICGYVIMLNGTVIAHKSMRQSVISDSSCQAEMIGVAAVMKELVYITSVLKELKMEYSKPCVYTDNSSVIDILESGTISSPRAKHFVAWTNFCRQYLDVFDVLYVSTDENVADTLTKSLGRSQFEYLRSKMMVQRSQGLITDSGDDSGGN